MLTHTRLKMGLDRCQRWITTVTACFPHHEGQVDVELWKSCWHQNPPSSSFISFFHQLLNLGTWADEKWGYRAELSLIYSTFLLPRVVRLLLVVSPRVPANERKNKCNHKTAWGTLLLPRRGFWNVKLIMCIRQSYLRPREDHALYSLVSLGCIFIIVPYVIHWAGHEPLWTFREFQPLLCCIFCF